MEKELIEDTWDLSSARAIQVAQFLSETGVKPHALQTVGFGHYRPIDIEIDTNTPESAAHNQRIDILISKHKISRRKEGSNYRLPFSRLPNYDSLVPE